MGAVAEGARQIGGHCGERTKNHERASETQQGAHCHQHHAFLQHQPQYLAVASAQSHSDADFLAPLRHRIAGDSSQAAGGKNQAEKPDPP